MNAFVRLLLVALTALLFAFGSAAGWSMDIVRDGKAVAVIVTNNSSQAAADVLADWIEKISGVGLQIVDRADDDTPAIYIGSAAIKAGLDLSGIDSPTKEGLRVFSDGKSRILIAGQNERSTVKAVCRFLEKLGCRYFMDHELGQVYPRSNTVTIGALNISEKPGLLMRRIWGS